MKYDYAVKCGGVYYAAGEEVPVAGKVEPPEASAHDGKAPAESAEPGDNADSKKPGRKPKAAGQ